MSDEPITATTIFPMYTRMGASRRRSDDPRSDVEVDRDRLVHSHAFRRLQRKTQVVGVNSIDFFRTRLTHTIECAQLGRAITRRLTDGSWEGVVAEEWHLPDLVEAACLAHDLGHPPFGHTGEEALDQLLQDRWDMRFEGNAQSFRIVTLLEPKKYRRLDSAPGRPLGLDLTRGTLRAMMKYPWNEAQAKATDTAKFGVYDDVEDLEALDWLWDGAPRDAHRTLATEILEAADDIAYAVHDIEDGTWARLIPIDQIVQLESWAVERIAAMAEIRNPGMFVDPAVEVEAELRELFAPLERAAWARGPFDRSRASEGGLKSFCSALTDDFLRRVTEGGSLQWTDNVVLQRRIAVLKAIIWVWLIEPPELVTKRHGQRRIIRELVDGFFMEPRMLPYQDEWQRVANGGMRSRVRFVTDHVASMTDTYAMRIHGEMYGTAPGSGWE
ncbi:MAG: deoxyguanosinetriphosphate triphosphohydrolase [Thermoleophilia bacterium]|nr:deoxyguanosinetriphosphate triphosphohydrolase [Thermoleophilia bacterium]MCZ4496675.1 deoxyguanosinetriphosphate triphosphohydrolase [Thermoleophilia bacterium]